MAGAHAAKGSTSQAHKSSGARSADGKASAKARRRSGQLRARSEANESATQQLLKDLLCKKDVDDDEEAVGGPMQSMAEDQAAASGPAPRDQRASSGVVNQYEAPAVQPLSPMELEEKRIEFMNGICSERTRPDARAWIEKVFNMDQANQAAAAMREAKEKRRRRVRSSSVASESGLSGLTGYTGVTGTEATALQTAGGSIAARSHRPQSVYSDESLVVHHSKGDEPLSMKERIQAFIGNRVPELSEHIDAHVARQKEELHKEVDEEVAVQFVRSCNGRQVFDSRTNCLRWQNARRQALQKRLDDKMGGWILEGIENWDQRKATEAKPKEVNETDLVFDYLTKRAAHIDHGKLPSQIPIIKTLRASYSLPRMWRDKYL